MMERINVTKSFLPDYKEFEQYLKQIWDSGQLTNHGSLLKQFEHAVQEYLDVGNFHFVTNGTMALQLALRGADITSGEVITTPFSYVATVSAILWERCTPVFVDINPKTFNIDAEKIRRAITKKTKAIMPVHVFGNPCDTKEIEDIAAEHDIKVIYDGAHAFGVKHDGKALLANGDVSICSFHATKLFHTIEGGCIITKDQPTNKRLDLLKRFGHLGDEHFTLGINAKASEFQAAMGLCNLKHVDSNIKKRKKRTALYDRLLKGSVGRQQIKAGTDYNYAYYPVVLKSEARRKKIVEKLERMNIFPRRYFFPSLNTLPYLSSTQACPESEELASRVLCLPLYEDLSDDVVYKISEVIAG